MFKIISSLSIKVIFFNWHFLFRLKWSSSFPKGFIIYICISDCFNILFLRFKKVRHSSFLVLRTFFFYFPHFNFSRNLFLSCDFSVISFEIALFIKDTWFCRASFCLQDACWYNIYLHASLKLKNISLLQLIFVLQNFDKNYCLNLPFSKCL